MGSDVRERVGSDVRERTGWNRPRGKKTLAGEVDWPHIPKRGMERGAAPNPLPVRA